MCVAAMTLPPSRQCFMCIAIKTMFYVYCSACFSLCCGNDIAAIKTMFYVYCHQDNVLCAKQCFFLSEHIKKNRWLKAVVRWLKAVVGGKKQWSGT